VGQTSRVSIRHIRVARSLHAVGHICFHGGGQVRYGRLSPRRSSAAGHEFPQRRNHDLGGVGKVGGRSRPKGRLRLHGRHHVRTLESESRAKKSSRLSARCNCRRVA
jgi:hypothetical protein